ncbi:hypothetical protein TgHK011_002297 [Trichoderma gracile]|nr:hypothetical protein TgHK011_002297 [Trichoderma gracile]
MESEKDSTKRVRGRTVTACLECRKMKKKCDRQWPCNHCSMRKMAHRCQFSQTTRRNRQIIASTETSSTAPSSFVVSETSQYTSQVTSPASAMHKLGYLYTKTDAVFGGIMAQYSESPTALPDPVLKASRVVPPRPYTDVLIGNFFDNVNYHYGILHQPSFMIAYVDWWSHRRKTQSESATRLTCLILRICANSAQFLSTQASLQLETDLGDSVQDLSRSYHDAAQTMSAFLSPASGDLVNAQQLFLAATWHKGEADFIQAWHELGAAVRVVQEMGVHTDSQSDELNEFDLEMRRRLWCALYTWDRYMAANFNRPPLTQSDTVVPLPNPTLDQQSALPDVPSIVVAKILENQLARQLGEGSPVDDTNFQSKLASVEAWMSSMPPAFRVINPEKRWDGDLILRRMEVVHAIGQALYMSRRLRGCTKMGDATWSILDALRDRISLTRAEKELLEETERSGKNDKDNTETGVSSTNQLDEPFKFLFGEDLRSPEDDLAADETDFLGMDLGILDAVWNWERVGF